MIVPPRHLVFKAREGFKDRPSSQSKYVLDNHPSGISFNATGCEFHAAESTICLKCLETEAPKRRGFLLPSDKDTCARGSQDPDLTAPLRATIQLLLCLWYLYNY